MDNAPEWKKIQPVEKPELPEIMRAVNELIQYHNIELDSLLKPFLEREK